MVKKCMGVRDTETDGACTNKARYEVRGLIAGYGVPMEVYLCERCLDLAMQTYPKGYPTIMAYNQYPIEFRKIGTKKWKR